MTYKLTKRTHANASWDKAVSENDPEARFLVGIEGDEIDDALATKLGLIGTKDAGDDDDIEDKATGRRKKQ